MLNLGCVICTEPYNETDDVCVTKCGHMFHYNCLHQWLNDSATCPQCRRNCNNSNILKVFLDSAIVSSDNANPEIQISTDNLEKAKQDIKDLEEMLQVYGEVNLDLTRKLEINENDLEECEMKLNCLRIDHEQLQNDLESEIKMRDETRVTHLVSDELCRAEMLEELESSREEEIRESFIFLNNDQTLIPTPQIIYTYIQ